jgi:tRNA1Val (adenine37-N6)-methyltransferase
MPDFTELWPGGPVFAQAKNQRLSTDSVLLADFVPLRPARRGIDLGCASGVVALLLLAREPTLDMTGLELDEDAAALARANWERNGLGARARVVTGDIRAHRELFRPGSFDFVAANPPYFPVGSGVLSPDPARAAARSETTCTLDELCRAAAWLLPAGGSFCVVHKPERLSELFCTMTAHSLEPKRLRLVSSRCGSPPSLVLVEGRRGGRPGLRIEAPLLLTGPDGRESAELRRICHRE